MQTKRHCTLIETLALALYPPDTGILISSFPTHVLHFTLDPNSLSILIPSSANSSVFTSVTHSKPNQDRFVAFAVPKEQKTALICHHNIISAVLCHILALSLYSAFICSHFLSCQVLPRLLHLIPPY